jgi:hypothetical protein
MVETILAINRVLVHTLNKHFGLGKFESKLSAGGERLNASLNDIIGVSQFRDYVSGENNVATSVLRYRFICRVPPEKRRTWIENSKVGDFQNFQRARPYPRQHKFQDSLRTPLRAHRHARHTNATGKQMNKINLLGQLSGPAIHSAS